MKGLAEDFKRFTSSLGPLARTTYATLRLGRHGLAFISCRQHGLRTLQELRERMKEEAKAAEEFVEAGRRCAEMVSQDVQEHLERMAASWTPFPAPGWRSRLTPLTRLAQVKRLEARLLEQPGSKRWSCLGRGSCRRRMKAWHAWCSP